MLLVDDLAVLRIVCGDQAVLLADLLLQFRDELIFDAFFVNCPACIWLISVFTHAGPTDTKLKGLTNMYDIHYNATHIMGTTGGNTADMLESLKLTEEGRIYPGVMVTHIGGLDCVPETTLNLPSIPGGKKLIYTHTDMPLTALTELRARAEELNDDRYAALADLVDAHNGLWNLEAEKFVLEHCKY